MPRDDDEIAYLSAEELGRRYRDKTLSPVDVTRTLLDRLDELEPKLNAFTVVDHEGALAAATQSEVRWRRGEQLSVLDGVPVTIKDLVMLRGFPMRRGSRLVPDVPDTEDGPAVARLKEDGAVILGKTTSPEFGWKALGDSPLTGITRNPWNLDRTPGGSSAGAAAACAAGIAPLHVGSDGAGSIRIPSCFSGIFGIKATFGRVPAHPPSPMGLLSNVGPLARSARDAALALNTLSRFDSRDPYTLPPHDSDFRDGIEDGVKRLRVAYSPDLGYARVDPEIAASVAAAAKQFEALGAKVDEVREIFPSPREALIVLWGAGAARVINGFPRGRRGECDPGFRAVAEAGEAISATDYVAADLARTALGRTMAEFHQRYDLLLTPMMPVPALPVGQDLNDPAQEEHWIDWSPFSYPFNMTRQPAATVPCGLTSGGLPIGLQIVGPLYAEPRVLRAARAFEATQPIRRPPL
ncbi:MAG TPA: amidase [Stellaceae bacterium]|jgi:aspartyl-tRNA(Asn)/glutamyl-tRNA(Gln) amidotransferase subunit A